MRSRFPHSLAVRAEIHQHLERFAVVHVGGENAREHVASHEASQARQEAHRGVAAQFDKAIGHRLERHMANGSTSISQNRWCITVLPTSTMSRMSGSRGIMAATSERIRS